MKRPIRHNQTVVNLQPKSELDHRIYLRSLARSVCLFQSAKLALRN